VKKNSYKAKDIQVLKGLEPVRRRPGMYIGNIDDASGLHQTIFEVIDNSVDECINGFGNSIIVTITKDGGAIVKDSGRGIPWDKHPIEHKPTVDIIACQLHAGGKFDNNTYQTSGGLHGVGISVVNALSDSMIIESRRNGKLMTRKYKRGRPIGKLNVTNGPVRSGTTVRFKPDPKIFKVLDFNFDIIKQRLQRVAFLNNGLKVKLVDERTSKTFEGKYSNGLYAFIKETSIDKDQATPVLQLSRVDPETNIKVRCALQWKNGLDYENIMAFTNTVYNSEGGSHVTGFKNALTRVVNKYMNGRRGANLVTGEDIRIGLIAIIDVRMRDPQFSSQVKSKLVSENARSSIEAISDEMENYFDKHPQVISKICSMSIASAEARIAVKRARRLVRKTVMGTMTSPLLGKLADCQSKKAKECELFIVEGDSAGGTSKQGRDRRYQAILPLRGKILNAEKASMKKLLDNNEIQSLVTAIGTGIGKNFNISNLRYDKLCIMTDADSVVGMTPILIEDASSNLILTTMADLVDNQYSLPIKTQTYSLSRRSFETSEVDQFINHKTDRKIFKIITVQGYSICVTSDHNIFSVKPGGITCMLTKDLSPGDTVLAPFSLPRKDREIHIGVGRGKMIVTNKIAEFIGVCLGCYYVCYKSHRHAQIRLNRDWRADRVIRILKSFKFTKWKVTRDTSGYLIDIFGGEALTIIRAVKLFSLAKTVPNELFNALPGIQISFLKGYFTSSGAMVNYCNGSKEVVCYARDSAYDGIITILRQLGMFPKVDSSTDDRLIRLDYNNAVALLGKKYKRSAKRIPVYKSLKIKSITPMDNIDNTVYDLSIPNNQNFVAGDGGFLVHNTDGEHIKVLLLTFFYRFMRKLVEDGHVYVAQPPLYGCGSGSSIKYALNNDELMALKIKHEFKIVSVKKSGVWTQVKPIEILQLPMGTKIKTPKNNLLKVSDILEKAKNSTGLKIRRFKGLGEMSEEQLWETSLDPSRRKLLRVHIEDAIKADEIISILMGNNVEARKDYISGQSKYFNGEYHETT